MLRIAVLISGGGTNLQAIIDACEGGEIKGRVVGIISNKQKAFGLERGVKHQIPSVYIGNKNYPEAEKRATALVEELETFQADLIVLAGYLEILHPKFIKAFENKIINIHPSLIPKYAGKGYYGMKVHEAVVLNKEKYSGATVHFVDEGVDTGRIILQETLALDINESPETLQKRVLHIEHKILIESLKKFCDNEL